MEKQIKDFIEELASIEEMPNVFNQYSYQIAENSIRRDNLSIYLKEMQKLKPKSILVGEAPGYRGSRLTGVPYTSEYILMNNDFFGEEKGYKLVGEKDKLIKRDKLIKEATASIIWETFIEYDIFALGWNAFPFHPHKEGNLESNRTPLKKELLLGEKTLQKIIEMYNIKTVVAMGNKAEESLNKLGISCTKVRHPAQGGKNEFVKGIRDLLA